MQIVIDTNIIVSAYLSGNGKCRVFMDQVYAGNYDVVVSQTILSEYKRVLDYPKFGFKDSTKSFVIEWFKDNAIMVEIDENVIISEMEEMDITDKPFYLLARATKSLLVIGNIKHYPVEEWRTMLWELV